MLLRGSSKEVEAVVQRDWKPQILVDNYDILQVAVPRLALCTAVILSFESAVLLQLHICQTQSDQFFV